MEEARELEINGRIILYNNFRELENDHQAFV